MIHFFHILSWSLLHLSCIWARAIHDRGLIPRGDDALGPIGTFIDGLKWADEMESRFIEDLNLDEPTTLKTTPDISKQDDSTINGAITTHSDTENTPVYQIQVNKCQNNGDSSTGRSNQCNVATLVIIYPKVCDKERNNVVTKALQNIPGRQGQLFISKKPCGVFFWRDQLTQSQIAELRKNPDVNNEILDIVPDRPLDHAMPGPSKGQPRKRDSLQTKEYPPGKLTPSSLKFVSEPNPNFGLASGFRAAIGRVMNRRPPQSGNPQSDNEYVYFSRSGEDVKVYMLGSGVQNQRISYTTEED